MRRMSSDSSGGPATNNDKPEPAVIDDMLRFIRDGLRRREGEDG